MGERLRLAKGRGPLGTGVFLLGKRTVDAAAWEARPWVCLLTVPIVPLARARFVGPAHAPMAETWEVEKEPLATASRSDVPGTLAGAIGALVLGLAPTLYAWNAVHETGPLEALWVVIGAAAPVLVLLWRDAAAPRVLR